MKTSVQTIKATPLVRAKVSTTRPVRAAVMPRADYLGSATNQIMILSTALPLIAGRFGLAPTSTRSTNAGLKLSDNKTAGLISNDPAGFTAADVLALGAFGHAIGVGIVLGLKGIGAL